MAANFQLIRKTEKEKGPVALNVIDEELCKFFGEPVDLKKYFHSWYNLIGFQLAIGRSFTTIRENFFNATEKDVPVTQDEMKYLTIVDYLEHHFEVNAFMSRK